MRIGLVCPYHMFRGGGVQEHVMALRDEYVLRGHYVRILTPQPRDYDGEIPEDVITIGGSVNTKAFAGTSWQWSVSVDTDAIDTVLNSEKFDVLHFHEPWIPVWSRQLVLRSQSANVATMHGRFLDTMTAKTITTAITPYTKPMINMFDAFTAVSEAANEYFRTLSHRHVTIVPNGIDLTRYHHGPKANPKSSAKSKKTIFYVGRLENRKGVKYLLDAYYLLTQRRNDVELLIAGTGPDEKKLKQYASNNDVPNVKFTGFISDDEKINLYRSSDLYCSPARYGESFGIVLLEAMASGCPVVAGDNLGYQSVMKDTGAISLVNPQDASDFSRRLEIMLYDEAIRKVWLDWAERYVKQFDYRYIADKYLKVYEQAVSRHHAKKT
ncbi:hypothetical protein A2884_00955 [Candidatus Saccharibacteria bacterium RIFCSPHIGHO2_01_FULL_48_12]|nr:MAG: hypothetical protein A2884_00955 [Candidatus Saccharibacteria bacterium RIFCSPHIGHO2_01_FULL_48_12]